MPLYLARWPDRTVTLMKAASIQELGSRLDEIADPSGCRVKEYNGPVEVTFQLKDRPVEPLGTLEAMEDMIGRKADTRGDVDELAEDMATLLDGDDLDAFADVTFRLAGGAEVRGHRAVLAARCGFFRKLFRQAAGAGDRVELPGVGAVAFKRVARYLYTGSPEFAPPANASYQPTTFTTTEAQAKATTQMNSFFTLLFETLVVARKFGLENLAVLIEIYMAQRFEGSFSREQLLDLIHVLEGAHAFDLHRLKSHCLHLLSCVTHQEHYLWDDKNVGAQLYGLPPALRNLPQDLQDEVESARTAAGNPTFASYFIREAVIRKDRTAVLRFLEARKSLTQPPCLGLGNLVHYATCQRDVEFLKFLLELGPDPNFQDSQGNTALHVAAALGSPQILEVLIQAGAKTSIRDKDDKIPLDHLRSARRQMRAFNACVGLYDSPVSENFLERNRYEESQWQAAEAILEDNGTENGTGACAASIRNPLDRHKRSGSKAAPTFAFDSLVVDRWWQAGEMPQLQLDTGSLGAGEGGLEFHDALFEFIAPHTSNALRKVQDLEVDVSRNQALEAVESALVQDFEGEQPKDELDKEVLDLTVALEVELGRAGGIIDEEESSV